MKNICQSYSTYKCIYILDKFSKRQIDSFSYFSNKQGLPFLGKLSPVFLGKKIHMTPAENLPRVLSDKFFTLKKRKVKENNRTYLSR